MTLGGLAIAIGELVDDAIIDVENVVRRLRENAARAAEAERRPVLDGRLSRQHARSGSSIVFATVIVVLVFLPLFFLGGVEGRLLRPLGFAYVVALFASLVVALTVTPGRCARGCCRASRLIAHGDGAALARRLKRALRTLARADAFAHARIVVAGAAVLLVAAAVAHRRSPAASFLPEFNEGALTVSAVTMPGTSPRRRPTRSAARSNGCCSSVPEVTSTARRTGRAELDEHVQGVESAEIDVRLAPDGPPARGGARRAAAEGVAAARHERHDRPADLAPHRPHAVGHARQHRGEDLRRRSAGRCARSPREVAAADGGGAPAWSTSPPSSRPTFRTLTRPRRSGGGGARRGSRPAAVAGRAADRPRRSRRSARCSKGRSPSPLVVRYAASGAQRRRVGRRDRHPDAGPARQVPLASLATIQRDRGPELRRCARTCSGGSSSRATSAAAICARVVDDIQARVGQQVTLPPGYHVEYGGQFESEAQASRQLLWLSLGVVVAIFLILSSAFGSIARRAADHGEPAARAHRRRRRRVSRRRRALGRVDRRLHHAVRHRDTQRHHARVAHPAPSRRRRASRTSGPRSTRGATERVVPILMTALAAGLALVPIALSAGRARERDPGADGDGDPVRSLQLHRAQHGRRPDPVRPVRRSEAAGAGGEPGQRGLTFRSRTGLRNDGNPSIRHSSASPSASGTA